MTRPTVIVGAGGHGRDVLVVLRAALAHGASAEFIGFVSDEQPDHALLVRADATWLGPTSTLASLPRETEYVIAVGSGEVRNAIDQFATSLGLRPATIVHPSAWVGDDVELGPGAVLCGGAQITTNVRVGRHVHLNLNATVAHDVVLGDYVTLNPQAAVSGCVVLEEGVTLGSGSVVIQQRTVGAWSTVGAGGVVTRDIPRGVVAKGVPARY